MPNEKRKEKSKEKPNEEPKDEPKDKPKEKRNGVPLGLSRGYLGDITILMLGLFFVPRST